MGMNDVVERRGVLGRRPSRMIDMGYFEIMLSSREGQLVYYGLI